MFLNQRFLIAQINLLLESLTMPNHYRKKYIMANVATTILFGFHHEIFKKDFFVEFYKVQLFQSRCETIFFEIFCFSQPFQHTHLKYQTLSGHIFNTIKDNLKIPLSMLQSVKIGCNKTWRAALRDFLRVNDIYIQ